MARILVVDDERKIRRQIDLLLGEEGHAVEQAAEALPALEMLGDHAYDLMITDVRLPDRTGIELLREARELQPGMPVLVITAYASVEDAVEAMRLGAFDYIQKPFKLEALRFQVERALSMASLRAEHRYMLDERRRDRGESDLVGDSPAMGKVRRLIAVAATQPSTVLLTGESGTGKELVAMAVHRQSGNEDRPLVKVNCPAIPSELFESELFGHERGAFTGAVESRRGKFELADGGTLFLDEVSEIPLALQAKLLRVLEDRRFSRVGGGHELSVDLRILAATNRDLEQAVAEGRFRQDLYFRLKIFPIHVPPLRARLQDIPALASHLIQRVATRFHMGAMGITDDALELLRGYPWPGNVRELRNVLERGVLLSEGGEIDVPHLPPELVGKPCHLGADCGCADSFVQKVEAYKREVLLAALREAGWRKKEAAEALGLSPRALSHYIGKYDLDRERGGA